MIVRYDSNVDAAHIYLIPPAEGVRIALTGPIDPIEAGAEINLDFDGQECWCSRTSRSRIASFVRLSKTIRSHKAGILAAIELGVSKRTG